ncbi:hypothetical protein [Croceibacter atlanticus]|jgi:hypothetical protein|uniref:Uncharacterized protein n=1 Tax=Croceibacter atlanticus (strain ATCC BAA-628 / JCM 21780 / CIP 108009 / IAM 15332 / KCTC 12090 / HTCC2559) TaxID=216432 RepID=A3U7B4_CROAH|nr:hypothetical protein [Croceibacter atlanticus]EAP88131.1 hypothetical protein CA2559_05210 [Croceibacter atlanticus HTCC2559]MBW4969663.1 hypothetical protein [Croceibacter atlanticus]
MNLKLSIEENKSKFLDEMITFEKKFILQHYFKTKKVINNAEREILKKSPSNEIETIALIGVLLLEKDALNMFRLRIGSVFKSDVELAESCQRLIDTKSIIKAETELFHYEYEYEESIEVPIIDYYIKFFK